MSANNEGRRSITDLPVELLLKVYESLSSFLAAVSLSSTCHLLQSVWLDHRSAIVNQIAKNHFECYEQALQLLAEQNFKPNYKALRNPSSDEEYDQEVQRRAQYERDFPSRILSEDDISKMMKNAKRVETLVETVEKFIPNLKVEGIPEAKKDTIYGGSGCHPSHLTPAERRRVIQGGYRILAWVDLDREVLRPKARTLRPRELYYLRYLLYWSKNVGFPTGDSWELFQLFKATSGLIPRFEIYYQPDHANPDLFAIWDHRQDNLKSLICGRPMSDLRRDAESKKMLHMWDQEPGDELIVEDD